jgi:hypothetical protein
MVGRSAHKHEVGQLSGNLVNHSFAAPSINTKVVNRSAQDLFPVMSLVKKEFTLREGRSAASLRPERMSFHKILKIIDLLLLINWPLN